MGLNFGKDVLYSLKGLTVGEVVDICRKLAELYETTATIDVDCSNIAFKVGKSASALSSFLMKWAETGVCAAPVWDGNVRPISKQATNKRKADREKKRIKSVITRNELRKLHRELYANPGTRTQTLQRIKELEKKCKSYEKAANNVLNGDLAKQLIEELERSSAHNKNQARGFVDKVAIAEWQADAYMIGRAVDHISVMMMTSDADMPILAGDDCLALKAFTKDGELEVVSTSKASIERAMSYLSNESRDRVIFTPAQYPIFEGVNDRKLRALMCLFLGCDVYKGMEGVGPKKLAVDIIGGAFEKYKDRRPENENVSLYTYLKKYLYSKTDGFDHEVVQAYIGALIYEPTNAAPAKENVDAGESCHRTYVGGAEPSLLPEYLREFAAEHTIIKPGPAMKTCIGVDEDGHKFLAADGSYKCNQCDGVMCGACYESIDNNTYCLLCYAERSIVRMPGEQSNRGRRTFIEMAEDLATNHNFDGAADLTYEELEDYTEVKHLLTARIDGLADDVPFPLYSSNEMDNAVCWQDVMEIDFGDGGSFIGDPDLDSKHLPALLEFLASLVTFKCKRRTDHVKDPQIYESMPEMLIEFAEKSRIDSGFRLLARTVRHAFDSRLTPMRECLAKFVIDTNGEVGMHLKSKIPASMKKTIYDTEIVATGSSLLGCKCSCQAGSQCNERIVCVHSMVRLYHLSLFLIDKLADNILCELSARIVESTETDSSNTDDSLWLWEMSKWSEREIQSLKSSAVLLMEAAGEAVPRDDLEMKSLPELLHNFTVGTQRRKEWLQRVKLPPKPSQLGPIHGMKFLSTAKQAKLATRVNMKCPDTSSQTALTLDDIMSETNGGDEDEIPVASEDDQETTQNNVPAYRKIWSLMNAAEIYFEDSSFVGMRLLHMRAETQDRNFTLQQKKTMDDSSKKEWLSLRLQSKKRSLNSTLSQRNNLKRKNNDSPTTPKQRKRIPRVVSPELTQECIADRTRLRRFKRSLPTRQKQPKKKRSRYIKCHMPGCPVNNLKAEFSHVRFHKVPRYPSELRSKSPKNSAIANRKARLFHRREMLRRMLIQPDSKMTHFVVCERHQFEYKPYSVTLQVNGKPWTQSYRLTLPKDIGPKSSENTPENSAGLGSDRQLQRVLVQTQDIINEGWVTSCDNTNSSKHRDARPNSITAQLRAAEAQRDFYEAKAKQHQADAVLATLALNQTYEQTSSDQHVQMNSTVQKLARLDQHISNPTLAPPNENGRFFKTSKTPTKSSQSRRKALNVFDAPTVNLEIDDEEVKRRTGFPTLQTLLAYILIVCDGDIAKVTERKTSLTWFEEWFLHFEYKWGRTLCRLWDIEKAYGPDRRYLKRLIGHKYNIERGARAMWPVYASHEEDMALRKSKWDDKYPRDQRIVMWDMTNIKAYGFSDADLQRLTYSKYYNQNCFKGGVFIQLCGWIGTGELWPGAVSDSDYNKREGYLERQNVFAKSDLVELENGSGNREILPFTNVYDKGYRAKAVAWKCGRQHVLQPDWAESDKHFRRDQTLRSASIATDRSGNERGVKVCKRSWFICRGFTPNMHPILINNAWTTWSFQSNFMFSPVL